MGLDRELAEFVTARMPSLLRFGLVLTGNPADAEDLVQTALARTALRWSSVRRRDQPEPYVRRAMVRLHVNRWRSVLSRERLHAEVPDRAAITADMEAVDERHAVWAALAALPPRWAGSVTGSPRCGAVGRPSSPAVWPCSLPPCRSRRACGRTRRRPRPRRP